MQRALKHGDIIRNRFEENRSDTCNLYLGSGCAGVSLNAWGVFPQDTGAPDRDGIGKTCLTHTDHWHRGLWEIDYWLPVAHLDWAQKIESPHDWRQSLDLYDGICRTQYSVDGYSLVQQAFYHPEKRDLLALEFVCKGTGVPDLILSPKIHVQAHYQQILDGEVALESENDAGNFIVLRLKVGTADTALIISVAGPSNQIRLVYKSGSVHAEFKSAMIQSTVLIGVKAWTKRHELIDEMKAVSSGDAYRNSAIQAWHKRWGQGFIELPDTHHQAIWARSVYHLLCSYSPDVASPSGPMGWSGNGWPFHFPQDVSYILPALLRLGHLDIARGWIEFYHSQIAATREMTQRVYRLPGTMWAWEHPIGPDSHTLSSGSPNPFQFEIHNAAYPTRMAYETAAYLGQEWARHFAWPIVKESAIFYAAALKRNSVGKWGIHVVPSMGQDEFGGENQHNYLCALFSAQYTLTTAIHMARQLGINELDPKWISILQDGLAYDRVFDPATGIYATCESGVGHLTDLVTKPKHPVPLNPYFSLPLGAVDSPTATAYSHRHSVSRDVMKKFSHGWTFPALLLADVHAGNAIGLREDLELLAGSGLMDRDHICFYESSGFRHAPFFVTSHGLYAQAVQDAFVNDYWNETRLQAAVPESWRGARYAGLRTRDGKIHHS